jgi:hypothetical protein
MRISWTKVRYFLIFFVILAVPFGLWRAISSRANSNIPQGFLESKQQTAMIGEQIVILSHDSAARIQAIEKLEQQGKYLEAIDAIRAEFNKVSEIRAQAKDLLEKLTDMTQDLANVRPEITRELALQAINYETQITDALISYSVNLDELLRAISGRYISAETNADKTSGLVGTLQDTARSIEELNGKYNQTMKQMEESVK